MEIDILNLQGEKTDTISVGDEPLGKSVSRVLLHRAVVSYEANLRQGNACTKTRGERAGTGKKPWKQKGTGRARAGSFQSPLWRGGGVTFGPKPRDYRMDLNKKEKISSVRGVLQGKLKDGQIKGIDSLNLSEPKTALVSQFLEKAEMRGPSLFVLLEDNPSWRRASKNIPSIITRPLKDLNALELAKAENIIFERNALDQMLKQASA